MERMKTYSKKFFLNLLKIRMDPKELYLRFFFLKFRWKYREVDKGRPCSNVEPYAFIRVHNEKPTLQCSLNSILPAITKGVIAYNDCTDGSEEIIRDFCSKNRGFIPARYDYFNLYPNESLAEKLTRYYNWVLSLMPRNEWLVKIDADQIYDAEKLASAFQLAKTTKDVIFLPRLELHYDDNGLHVLSGRPFNFCGDHWVIFNDGNLFFTEWEGAPCEALVMLDEFQRNIKYAPISNWHFAALKPNRKNNIPYGSGLTLFDEWKKNWDGKVVDGTLSQFDFGSGLLDSGMLDKDRIMKHVACFELGV